MSEWQVVGFAVAALLWITWGITIALNYHATRGREDK